MIGNPGFADNLLRRFEELPKAMEEYVLTIYHSDEFQDFGTKLIEEQLQSGIRGDGQPITPPYRPKTISYKKKKGDPYDRVTLKDYGDFYNGLRFKQYSTKLEIISQDSKSEELQAKYTPQILDMLPENIEKLRMYILPFTRTFSRKFMLT